MPLQKIFCPEQTDFLIFQQEDGYGAVQFNLLEGFLGFTDEGKMLTTIHLSNGSSYVSTETVPALVIRCAELKQRRYTKERGETELVSPGGGSQPTIVKTEEIVQKTAVVPEPERRGFTFRPPVRKSE